MSLMKDLVTKYRVDTIIVLGTAVIAFLASVLFHAEMKPITRLAGLSGPIVFASVTVTLIGVMQLAARWPAFRPLRRGMFTFAVGSVVVFAAMFRAEMFYAPIAWHQGKGTDEVVGMIASNQNVARYAAWSRLMSMNRAEKEAVAVKLAEVAISGDEGARASATMTLDLNLRKFTIPALLVMRADLEEHLRERARGVTDSAEPTRSRLAGEFARAFIARNWRSVLKAMAPKNRGNLPAGGLEVLTFAMASDPLMGHIILKGFAGHGDEKLKPLATRVGDLAAIDYDAVDIMAADRKDRARPN